MKQVRWWKRFAARDFWAVGVVAIDANLAREPWRLRIPLSARSPMGPGLPIAVSRAVATTAQARAVFQLHFVTIARLEQRQVLLIVTIEADIIAVVTSVLHHDILVLLGDDDVLIGVVLYDRRFAFFVAGVTIEIREVGFGADKLQVGGAEGGGCD